MHAQDRFFEMDFRRHPAAGQLSELFGQSQVETDAYVRTLGWQRVAEQELSLLAPRLVGTLMRTPLASTPTRRPTSRRSVAGAPAQAAGPELHASAVDGRRFCGLAQGHGLGSRVEPHSGGRTRNRQRQARRRACGKSFPEIPAGGRLRTHCQAGDVVGKSFDPTASRSSARPLRVN